METDIEESLMYLNPGETILFFVSFQNSSRCYSDTFCTEGKINPIRLSLKPCQEAHKFFPINILYCTSISLSLAKQKSLSFSKPSIDIFSSSTWSVRSSTFSVFLFPVFLLLSGLSGVRPPLEDAGFIPFVVRLGLEFNTTV